MELHAGSSIYLSVYHYTNYKKGLDIPVQPDQYRIKQTVKRENTVITVLYVDDEETLLEIGKTYLELSGEISVDTALSADEGLQKIRKMAYDAIVSDYQMPGMDGIRFLVAIKKEFPLLPFILFTGRGREEIVIEAYENGADFYLQKGGLPKPLFTELSHKIEAVVDHRRDEERVKTFNRLYSVLSATNKAIVHIRDKRELLSEICRVAVEIGGFSLVWAGIANPLTHTIEPFAFSGKNEGYLDEIHISSVDGPGGHGPSSVAYHTGNHVISNDIASDPAMVAVRAAALQRGFRALSAFPFAPGTHNAGVITFYASLAGFFDNNITSLLEEMTHDITFAFGTIDDEEQRKAAEERLQRERNFSMTLIQASPIFYIAISPGGSIILMNDTMLNALGYSKSEVIGKPYLETIVPESERTDIQQLFDRLAGDKISTVNENHVRRRTGEELLVEWHGKPVLSGSGEIDFFFGVGIDITRRRLEEKSQEDTLAFLNAIVDQNPNSMWISDNKGYLMRMNAACTRLLNATEEELKGKYTIFSDTVVEEQGFMPQVRSVFSEGKIASFQISYDSARLRSIDLHKHVALILDVTIFPIKDVKGTVTNAVIHHNDITSRKQAEENLIQSEEHFRTLFTTMAQGVIYQDRQGKITSANPSAERILGISADQMLGLSSIDPHGHAIHEDLTAYPGESHPSMLALKTGEKQEGVMGVFNPVEKSIHWILMHAVPQFRPGGDGPGGVFTTLEDITSKKRNEEQIRQSDQRLTNLMANLPGMAYRCRNDLNWTMEYVSDGSRALTDYEPEDLVNNAKISYEDLIAPEDRNMVRAGIQDAISQKKPFAIVYRIITAGGLQKWVWEQGSCTEWIAGEPAVLEGFVTDLTERVRNEQALEESENRYHTLFETAAEGIIVADTTTREFLHANPAICAILGYSEEELLEKHVEEIHPAENLAFVLHEFEALSRGEKQRATEIPCVRKDRTIIYVDIATSEVTIDNRHCIVGFFLDVTERKQRLLQMLDEHEFSIVLLNTRTLPEILSFSVNSAIRIGHMDSGGIYTVDAKTHSLDLAYSAGLSEEFIKLIAHLAPDSPQAGIVYQKRPVYSQHNLIIDQDNPGRNEGIRAIAIIPVIHNDEVIACFNIASHTRETIPDQDRSALENIASQLGNVIARVMAEVAYHESEKRYHRLVEAVSDYIYTVRVENGKPRETWHGPGCEGITGYRSEAFAVDPYLWLRMIVEEDRPAVVRQAEDVLAGRDRTPLEHRIIRKDGALRWVKNTPVSRYNQQGDLIAYDGLIEDITERRQAGEALKLANRKLNLLSEITRHDILNQLMALSGVIGMIQEQTPDASLSKLLEMGERATKNINRQIRFTKEYQDLGNAAPLWQNVQNTYLSASKLLQTGDIRIIADTGSLEIYADPLLEKVFYNLIDNALTHAGKITRISLQNLETQSEMIITVEDDGIGVPAEEKSRIFDRGFGKHTGLGLFLSQEILSITSITITESGMPGSGARFQILVPKGVFRIAGNPP